jgi:hypothetical protein
MSELLKRATALALYRRWFYAPHYTGRRCAVRLEALGFTWSGSHWARPSRDEFVWRVMALHLHED